MKLYFEGYKQAHEEAEKTSRKLKNELVVAKTNLGGIKYAVCLREELQPNDKIMTIYKNGIVEK